MSRPDQLLAVSTTMGPYWVYVCTHSKEFTDTSWLVKMDGFLCDFKVNIGKDREPMKFLTEWSAASEPGGHSNHSLNTLEFSYINLTNQIEERIAVFQSAAD